jgi:hypothetical protein
MTTTHTTPRVTSLAPQFLVDDLGATILRPLAATAWGTMDFYIEDPDGYIIAFGGNPAKTED